jgi:DHA1 family tetracycline resistance protein-like MFS transporter
MKSASLGIVFLTALIDMIGFGIVIPILPYFAEHLGASPFEIGLLTGSYLLMQLITSPLWGRWSDRIGRRPVLIMCLTGSAGAYLLFAFADSLGLILVARILGGALAGKFSTLQAIIADVTDHETRAKGMGYFGAAFGLGFIIGPVIGGWLGQSGYQLPLFGAAILAAFSALAAALWLGESLPAERRGHMRSDKGFRDWLMEFSESVGLMRGFTLGFLFNFAFSILYVTFALFVERRLDFHTRETGYLFGFMGVVSAILQGGMMGKLSRRYSDQRLILAGLLTTGVGFILLGIVTELILLLAATTAIAVGSALLTPTLSAYVSKQASAGEQGQVMGYFQSTSTLARMLGMIAGGAIFIEPYIFLPFIAGAIILLGASFYVPEGTSAGIVNQWDPHAKRTQNEI